MLGACVYIVCMYALFICVCVCVDCFCRFDLRKGLHCMRKVLKCAFAYDSLMVMRKVLKCGFAYDSLMVMR